MTILVTGSTGTIGSQVVQRLAGQGARLRGLVRDASKGKLPAGVELIQGDRRCLLGRFLRLCHAAKHDGSKANGRMCERGTRFGANEVRCIAIGSFELVPK